MSEHSRRLIIGIISTIILVILSAFGYLYLASVNHNSNGNGDGFMSLSSLLPSFTSKHQTSNVSSKFSRTFPFIHSSTGRMQGIYVDRLGIKVSTFLGIPYAVPPVGSLRFSKPEPYKWRGVFVANKKPASCMQFKSTIPLPWNDDNITRDESEDCLKLNIWTPDASLGPSRETSERKLNRPILVWIYGGGFVSGSVNMPEFDGSILAAYTDSVVAMMNYRVGVFGFLNVPSTDIQGNMGLHDQVLAIEWIRENADKFGGDPNLITLIGESSGAASIGFHMISPLSRDLFKRSILQSGSPLMPLSLVTRDQVEQLTNEIATMTNCTNGGSIHERESLVNCLKKIPVKHLLKCQAKIITRKDDTTFTPTFFDDDFTSVNPFDAFRSGDQLGPQKEVLMGFNKDEGSIFMYFANATKYPALYSSNLTTNNTVTYDEIVTFATHFMKNQDPLMTRNLLNTLYYTHINETSSNELFDVTKRHVGEFCVICPTIFAADDLSRNNVSVYMYHFVHRPKSSPWLPWVGSAHYDEVQFVFGLPLIKPSKYTKDEIKLSKKLMNTWSSFARYGLPVHQKNFDWPTYDEVKQSYVEIAGKSSRIKHGIPNDKCKFWRLTFEVANAQVHNDADVDDEKIKNDDFDDEIEDDYENEEKDAHLLKSTGDRSSTTVTSRSTTGPSEENSMTTASYDDSLTTTLKYSPVNEDKNEKNSSKLIPLGRNIALLDSPAEEDDDDSSVDY